MTSDTNNICLIIINGTLSTNSQIISKAFNNCYMCSFLIFPLHGTGVCVKGLGFSSVYLKAFISMLHVPKRTLFYVSLCFWKCIVCSLCWSAFYFTLIIKILSVYLILENVFTLYWLPVHLSLSQTTLTWGINANQECCSCFLWRPIFMVVREWNLSSARDSP